MEKSTRSGFVALIGRPNVGKSTLMNRIIGQKIAITSRKPQTTRNRIRTVYTCERGQIIFLDTPGLHKAKNRLGQYMVRTARNAMKDVDVIIWVVEPSAFIGNSDMNIAGILKETDLPKILVINKTDKVKKSEIPNVAEAFGKLCAFDRVEAVSGRHGTNVDRLVDTIFTYLPYGPLYYEEETVTDQPVKQIISELIREKALRSLGEEVPHGIAVLTESVKKRPDKDITDIEASVICERDSHKGIIIGRGGERLKKIGSESRPGIEELVGGKVNLSLRVKVRKGWRDSSILLRNFGYDDE